MGNLLLNKGLALVPAPPPQQAFGTMHASVLCSQQLVLTHNRRQVPGQHTRRPSCLPSLLQAPCTRRSRLAGHATTIRAAGDVGAGVSAAPGLKPELRKALEDFVSLNKIVLFMKGTQQFPQCGFSNTCVQIFHALGVPTDKFTCVNILEDDSLRSGLKEFSQWPTFPQVYIDGEFYGGCDIMIESFQKGELQEVVERVMNE